MHNCTECVCNHDTERVFMMCSLSTAVINVSKKSKCFCFRQKDCCWSLKTVHNNQNIRKTRWMISVYSKRLSFFIKKHFHTFYTFVAVQNIMFVVVHFGIFSRRTFIRWITVVFLDIELKIYLWSMKTHRWKFLCNLSCLWFSDLEVW